MNRNIPLAALILSGVLFNDAQATTPQVRVLDIAQPQRASGKKAPTQTPVRVAQNDAQLAALEKLMAQLVNAARKNAKLPPLLFDDDLAQVARAHSLEMRDRKYFAHESPTPNLRDPLDRYRAAFGETPAVVAENVYRAWSSAPRKITAKSMRDAHTALMNSPHHRENILRSGVQRIGIGLIVNANGDIWITQMFSRPTWD